MRTFKIIIPVLLLIAANAYAQTPATETEHSLAGRASAGIEWKLVKDLHLETEYELRTTDSFAGIERHQINLGVKYSPAKNLDLGAGYYFIGHYDSEGDLKPRHRFYADVTGSHKAGAWKLSLRERIELTRKPYELNEFQQNPNLLELKSRLKLAYKGFARLEPYVYAELRNCFNGPSFNAEYNESTGKYSDYEFTGYDDVYVNRLRGVLGMEWKHNKSHSVDFRLMEDYCRNKVIDTNSEGTKLKSYAWEKALNTSLTIGYVFSF